MIFEIQFIKTRTETLNAKKEMRVTQISKQLGISKATLYKYLRHRGGWDNE